jgi:hypothetical protein
MIENTDTHTHLSDAIRYDVHSKEQVDADLKVLDEVFAEVKRLREWIEQAVDVWENCNHEDRTDWFNNFCEVMKE